MGIAQTYTQQTYIFKYVFDCYLWDSNGEYMKPQPAQEHLQILNSVCIGKCISLYPES